MEIRFSKPMPAKVSAVYDAATDNGVIPTLTKVSGLSVRFTLDTDEAGHDRVIRALLTLDPDATIRTARAVYDGLVDFEAQFKARVP